METGFLCGLYRTINLVGNKCSYFNFSLTIKQDRVGKKVMPLLKRKQTSESSASSNIAMDEDTQNKLPTGNERRQHGRIVRPSGLTIFAKHPGFIGKFHQPDGIKVLDFSRYGLAFESDHKYKTGEELSFEISEHSNQVDSVVGFVTHAEVHNKKYRCGIQFDFTANDHMRSEQLEQDLTNIEQNLLSQS